MGTIEILKNVSAVLLLLTGRLLLLSDGLSGCVAFLEGAAPQARKADALRRAHRRAQ